ncbi:hypothetical protein [Desulfolutivibrio sp.]|uniref:hypothetical protein n=1 Tax=Desulfolutivibrio sp. TaxID=2773296 RepID=UPI002F962A26
MFSIGHYFERMGEIACWLKSLGINYDVLRFSRYKQYANNFFKRGTPIDSVSQEEFILMTRAIYEAYYINVIMESFKHETDAYFVQRLGTATKGRDFLDANEHCKSRDYLFELVVASNFAKQGYKIDFKQKTDVVATREDDVVYIECKRLSSADSLKKNFNKAGKQLQKLSNKIENKPYGLIVIDICSAIDGNAFHQEFPCKEQGSQFVEKTLDAFCKQNESTINSLNKKYLDCSFAVYLSFTGLFCVQDPKIYIVKKDRIIACKDLPDKDYRRLGRIVYNKRNNLFC